MQTLNARAGAPRMGVTYQLALFILLVFLVVLFGVIEPVFFQPDVLFDVTAIIGEIGIMALAMTFIITTGGIDLSVGYILQLSAIVFGSYYTKTHDLAGAVALAVATGIACGFINGIIISRTKIPPLVTTLATMNLYRGISMIVAGSETYSGFTAGFKAISTTYLFDIVPIQFIYLLVFFLIFHLYYTRGKLGRNLKGIGFNENVLKFSGINTKRSLLFIYTLTGLMCSLAALVYLGRLSAATTSMGNDLNLQVITAVVLGGTSIMGGIGSVAGTFIGTLIIGVLRKGFTLLNFSGNIFNFTLGVILIVALIAFALLEERKKTKGSIRERAAARQP
jgi:ribose/xylose/arabinose/galactoside ABC-type transport system permease subunit